MSKSVGALGSWVDPDPIQIKKKLKLVSCPRCIERSQIAHIYVHMSIGLIYCRQLEGRSGGFEILVWRT